MARPNRRRKDITLDELAKEILGEELVEAIDNSDFRLLLRTPNGDAVGLRLSRATTRKLTGSALALLTTLGGYLGWSAMSDQTINAQPTRLQANVAAECSKQNP